MLKKTMLLLVIVAGMIFGQDAQTQKEMSLNDYIDLAKEDLAVQSKKLMMVNMQLTEEEGAKYWPIYDEYFAERSKIMDEKIAMIGTIVKKYGSLTEKDASDLAKTFFDIEKKQLELKEKTYKKIEKEISGLRGIQFLQIQGQIDTILKLQISSQFPLLK
jgi:hypothetical protein